MSDLDLVGLRKIAGKATQGRWVFSSDDGSALDADVVFALDDAGEEVSTVTAWLDANDAEHIAAFDPPTVLALLDLIAEQQAELNEYREWDAEVGRRDEMSERITDERLAELVDIRAALHKDYATPTLGEISDMAAELAVFREREAEAEFEFAVNYTGDSGGSFDTLEEAYEARSTHATRYVRDYPVRRRRKAGPWMEVDDD